MRNRNAFTLVELLIVIGIIALLVAILLPTLNKARDASKVIVCASQLRQIGIAVTMYGSDYKQHSPILRLTTAETGVRKEDDRYGWCIWAPHAGDPQASAMAVGLLVGKYLTITVGQGGSSNIDGGRAWRVLYCPAQLTWFHSDEDQGSGFGWSGFGMQPPPLGDVTSGYFSRTSQQLSKKPVRALVSDMWYGGHNVRGHKRIPLGDNVLYSDGAVKWVPETLELRIATASNNWGFTSTRNVWAELDREH